MYSIGLIGLIGFAAGILGTGFGGLVTVGLRRPSDRLLGVVLGGSAGIMLSVVCFELMPQAIATGGLLWGVVGALMGVGLLVMTDLLTPHSHAMAKSIRSVRLMRAGVLLGIGIAMHNFPEGLAIGSSFVAAGRLGLGITTMIFVQNIPEGMAMAVPLIAGGTRSFRAIEACCAAGLPMGAGAFVGAVLGGVSPVVLAISLGLAGGAMIYITCDELIPEGHEMTREGARREEAGREHSATFGIVAGLLVGIVMAYVL